MLIMGQERDYVVHDENNVKGFFGEYRFLSNFEVSPALFEGLMYPSSENAYQAAKWFGCKSNTTIKRLDHNNRLIINIYKKEYTT